MLNRGFIGPVGDDLPSLIPLLFGLVIFFSTFTLTFDAFESKNSDFKADIGVMRVSRIMQSNSYIYNHSNFQDLCSQIGPLNLKFAAIISSDGTREIPDSERPENFFEVNIFRDKEGMGFYCTNIPEDELEISNPEKISDFITLEEALERKLVSRIFPIVVEDEKIVKPMHLFVVAWK